MLFSNILHYLPRVNNRKQRHQRSRPQLTGGTVGGTVITLQDRNQMSEPLNYCIPDLP